MLAKVKLGEDVLLWGEDDVRDFLAQYGHVQTMEGRKKYKDDTYLFLVDRNRPDGLVLYDYPSTGVDLMVYHLATPGESFWESSVWVDDHDVGPSNRDDLLAALNVYLEKRDEVCHSGR